MPDELKTVTVSDVEVARVGRWRSANAGWVTITTRDLDDMVSAHKATAAIAPVPLKLGHAMRQAVFGELAGDVDDGEPAFGWVVGLRRDGERLLTSWESVPAKLAAFLRAKAWRNRSPEIAFDREIGGKRYRRVLRAVALLGAIPPAIEGMADLYAAAGEPDGETHTVLFGAGPDDMTEEELVELARRILAEFTRLRGDAEPLIRYRKGAPLARSLFDGFEAQLRRAARVEVAMKEQPMNDEALRGALGLEDTATPDDIVAALKAADAEQMGVVVKLAGEAFASADTFVAWLAGKLGVLPGDLNAIATAVSEALGLDTSTEQQPTDGTATPPPAAETQMSEGKETAKMSEELVKMTKRLAELEGRVSRDDASKDVDALIAAGKAVPAQRETLISLRLGSPAQFSEYAKTLPVVVHMGEQGTAAGADGNLSTVETQAARDAGVDPKDYAAFKAARTAASA